MITVQTSVLVDTFAKYLGRPEDQEHVSGQFGDFDPKGWSKLIQNSDGGLTGESHDGGFEMKITNPQCTQKFLNELKTMHSSENVS